MKNPKKVKNVAGSGRVMKKKRKWDWKGNVMKNVKIGGVCGCGPQIE
jgi:hypothetical protein